MESTSHSFRSWLRDLLAGPPRPAGGDASAPGWPGSAARWEDILRVQALTVGLLTKKVTPGELFRHIVEGAADSLGAHEASLILVEGDELRVVAAVEAHPRPPDWRTPMRLGEGVAGVVAETGAPVLLNDGDDLSRFPRLTPKGDRIQSAVSVPLEVGGRVVGVLSANRLTGGKRFTSEDLAVLQLFGGTAALAIDQANILQRTQARARALETLVSMTEAFAGSAAPSSALVSVLPTLGTVFHSSWALAFLGTREAERLDAVAGWTGRTGPSRADDLVETALAVEGDVARAFDAREPVWTSRLPLRGVPGAWGSLPVRLLVIPAADVQTVSRCAIVLGWSEPDFTLTAEDFRVLDALARQVEMVLSHQDRADAAGALEAEMAQARAHLVEVERLATIGQSMAGLVHDINAPLTAVITFAQLIQKEGPDAKSHERAGQITAAAQRAQRLVRELLTMTRPHPPSFQVVDLHALLRAAMDLERPQCSASGIKLTADFDPDLPPVTADPHRLGQVFINLLVNARQAIDGAEKGTAITVRTRRGDTTVEIQVADNGPGIPPAVKARVFDWFFTTKPPGEGTGLGLAVSREILLTHGGNLRIDDTPGGGATFVLELPLGPLTA